MFWGHIWKYTVGKIKQMHPLKQAIWGNIWKIQTNKARQCDSVSTIGHVQWRWVVFQLKLFQINFTQKIITVTDSIPRVDPLSIVPLVVSFQHFHMFAILGFHNPQFNSSKFESWPEIILGWEILTSRSQRCKRVGLLPDDYTFTSSQFYISIFLHF